MIKKRILQRVILLILTIILGLTRTSAQKNDVIHIFTDRNMYITNEKILFSVILSETYQETTKVLYLDLISAAGMQLAGKKMIIQNACLSSAFPIPSDAASGSYFLRAYIGGIEEKDNKNFSYIPLKIINIEKEPFTLHTGYKTAAVQDSSANIASDAEILLMPNDLKHTDSLKFELKLSHHSDYKHLAVSVVPLASVFFCDSCKVPLENAETLISINENNGLAISGKVLDGKTNAEIKNAHVFLSYPTQQNIFPAYTDTTGKLSLLLPHYTESGKLILALEERKPEIEPIFQINKEFAPIPSVATFPSFDFNEKEKKAALRLIQNQQLKNIFYESYLANDSVIKKTRPFYVKEDIRINLDEYIALPELQDYFTEIDLDVKLEKANGERYFKVKGTQPELNFYKPLVMIDYVYVQNADDILKLSPKLISHIEVVTHLYLKGEFIFGGIINFITKDKDFGGLKFTESTITFDYQFLHQASEFSLAPKLQEQTPDIRNTYFWKSYTSEKINDINTIKLLKPQLKGEYLIYIQLLNKQNKVSSAYKSFIIE